MKVLNLDGFAQVKRQMTLKGVNHDVLETSVQQFIDNLAAAAKASDTVKHMIEWFKCGFAWPRRLKSR